MIDTGSVTSRTIASIPGCSAVMRSTSSLRRPATITLLPAYGLVRAQGQSETDTRGTPVIKTVSAVIFTVGDYEERAGTNRPTGSG